MDSGLPSGRDEAEYERVDRNLVELLTELRVAMPGVQVLFAFLLIVPFNRRFTELSDLQRYLYLVSLLCAGAATVSLVAPIAHHRVTFRLQDKAYTVYSGNRFALAALAFLAVAMTAAVTLVTSAVFGTLAGVLSASGAALAFAVCWAALPLRRRRRIRR